MFYMATDTQGHLQVHIENGTRLSHVTGTSEELWVFGEDAINEYRRYFKALYYFFKKHIKHKIEGSCRRNTLLKNSGPSAENKILISSVVTHIMQSGFPSGRINIGKSQDICFVCFGGDGEGGEGFVTNKIQTLY